MALYGKVVKVPGKFADVALEGEATVADALNAADIGSTDGYKIELNGSETTTSTALTADFTVTLTKNVKGA